MSALARRRRRAPRKWGTPVVVGGLCVAVLLAVLIGGLLNEPQESTPYWRSLDRSFATNLSPLVRASNAVGTRARTTLTSLATASRTSAERELDTLVQSADALAAQAVTLATPSPQGGVGAGVTQVLTDRAEALTAARTAIDRLLGMSPLPPAGPAGAAATVGAPPAPLDVAGADRALSRIAGNLRTADRSYAAARRELSFDAGHAALPASSWTGGAGGWWLRGLPAIAPDLDASATLAPTRDVVLVVNALDLTPAPVPPTPHTAPTVSVVPPTTTLAFTVVVANEGNVAARRIPVRVVTVRHGDGRRRARSTSAALEPGGSVSVALGPIPVRSGTDYTVTVSIGAPSGEVPGATTSDTFVVDVAPAGTASS